MELRDIMSQIDLTYYENILVKQTFFSAPHGNFFQNDHVFIHIQIMPQQTKGN